MVFKFDLFDILKWILISSYMKITQSNIQDVIARTYIEGDEVKLLDPKSLRLDCNSLLLLILFFRQNRSGFYQVIYESLIQS